MGCNIKLIFYGYCHFIISNISDLSLVMKLLIENTVFDNHSGRESNKSDFIDLYFYKTKTIIIEDPLI